MALTFQTTNKGVADNHPAFLCEFDCTMGIAADESCDCRRWLGVAPAGFTPEAVCDCCGDEMLEPAEVAATDGDEIFCKTCLEAGLLGAMQTIDTGVRAMSDIEEQVVDFQKLVGLR